MIVILLAVSLTVLFTFVESPAQAVLQGIAEDIQLYLPLALRNSERVAWMGPDGGTITALAVDPKHPEVIYAGTWGAGIFKSANAGETWRSISQGLGVLYVNSLAIDPKKSQVLYAGTYRGKLYKSNDAGATWYLSSQGIQDEATIYAIAVDPLDTQKVYIATRGISNQGAPPWRGVVYKSIDGGGMWSPSLTNAGGSTVQDWVYSLSIHPRAPNILYAAAHEQGPYRSMDAGVTWEVIENGITDASGRAITVDPLSNPPAVVYFGVWHGGGVFKSTNGGESWSQISNGVYSNKVFSIAIDPLDSSVLYLGTIAAGVMKTLDGGKSWSPAGLNNEEIFTLAVNPANPQVIYAGTVASGLYRSLDAGAGWQSSQAGLKGSPVTSLIVDGQQPRTYYTSGLENGVSISTDHGKTWADYSTGLPDRLVNGLTAHPIQENLLYALTGSSGLYRRLVGGSDGWVQFGEGLPEFSSPVAEQERLDAAYPNLSSELHGSAQTMVYAPLLTMVFAPSDDAIVYLGTQGAGVYKSLDGGLSWLPTASLTGTVRTLAVDPLDPQIVYAANETAGGLHSSPDGGSTWLDGGLPERMVNAIGFSDHSEHAIYVGTDDGVYRQAETGWVQSGLGGLRINSITLHPAVDGLVFAATQSGAYMSTDGSLHWHPATPELSGTAVSSILVDTHDPRVVYFITPTRGILRAQLSFQD